MKKRVLFLSLLSMVFFACQSGRDRLLSEIKQGENVLMNDSLKLNDSTALRVLQGYQNFAKEYPEDAQTPEYLFKAGEVANALGRHQEAVAILANLPDRYPAFNKGAEALFLAAFVTESSLNDKEGAQRLYAEVIKRYPKSPLREQAELSIQNMDKSLDDLVKEFEAKNAQ